MLFKLTFPSLVSFLAGFSLAVFLLLAGPGLILAGGCPLRLSSSLLSLSPLISSIPFSGPPDSLGCLLMRNICCSADRSPVRSPVAEEGEAERKAELEREAADPPQSLQECGRVPGAPGGTSSQGPWSGLEDLARGWISSLTWPRNRGAWKAKSGTLGVPTPRVEPPAKAGRREAGAVKGKNLSPPVAERRRAWGAPVSSKGRSPPGGGRGTCGASAPRLWRGRRGARRAGRRGL